MSRAEHTAELTRLRAAASELLTSSDNVIAALHNEAAGYDAAGTSVYERNAKARIVLASLLGYGATEPAVSYDAARIERIAAIRKSLVTDADCVALAQWIDDEICALGMRLVALHPEKREVLGRLLNNRRIAVAESLRFVGIER